MLKQHLQQEQEALSQSHDPTSPESDDGDAANGHANGYGYPQQQPLYQKAQFDDPGRSDDDMW